MDEEGDKREVKRNMAGADSIPIVYLASDIQCYLGCRLPALACLALGPSSVLPDYSN
jgi:hypothetical protein